MEAQPINCNGLGYLQSLMLTVTVTIVMPPSQIPWSVLVTVEKGVRMHAKEIPVVRLFVKMKTTKPSLQVDIFPALSQQCHGTGKIVIGDTNTKPKVHWRDGGKFRIYSVISVCYSWGRKNLAFQTSPISLRVLFGFSLKYFKSQTLLQIKFWQVSRDTCEKWH